jgi:DNA-cytosine methyltransferase
MNVLSLFDGMSCGQIALERAEIKVDNYFASEIDKYAIKITQKNYPNTIQLGDVNNWIDWHLPKIDLLIGGSPCQGFSNAGQGLNFDDPRSKLFFKFVDCLKWYKPTWFLLENVRMKKEWQEIISEHLGVEPIRINSALVSAQNRDRFYWTNIPNITQPEDRNIFLEDVLQENVDDKYYTSDNWVNWLKNKQSEIYKKFVYLSPTKAGTLTARMYASWRGNFIFQLPHGNNKGGNASLNNKIPSITSSSWEYNNLLVSSNTIRRLTEIECERLQTVPDNYTEGVSSSQRYKMLGNGWTVDVIAYIFSFIPKE